jgi:hypothetical protein
MKKTSLSGVYSFSVLATAAVIVGCNSAGFQTLSPVRTTGLVSYGCGPPPKALRLEVLYPKPKSRDAPPSLTAIWVSTKTKMPTSNGWDFDMVEPTRSGFSGYFFQGYKSQIPNPHATPRYSHPFYYYSSTTDPYGSRFRIGRDESVALLWNDTFYHRQCEPNFVVSTFTSR